MKPTAILKGILGLAIIYLVCLPICSIAKAVETNKSHTELRRKVEFSPTGKVRLISPNEKEFVDGYFNIESGECLAKQRGLLKV
jgi:hypothetical protein